MDFTDFITSTSANRTTILLGETSFHGFPLETLVDFNATSSWKVFSSPSSLYPFSQAPASHRCTYAVGHVLLWVKVTRFLSTLPSACGSWGLEIMFFLSLSLLTSRKTPGPAQNVWECGIVEWMQWWSYHLILVFPHGPGMIPQHAETYKWTLVAQSTQDKSDVLLQTWPWTCGLGPCPRCALI